MFCRIALLVPITVSLLSGFATADVVWQPSTVTSHIGTNTGPFSPSFLNSQIGLSSPYISGVTNATTYTATHNNDIDEWVSHPNFPKTGFLTFDMGQTIDVTGFRLWNSSYGDAIGDYDVDRFRLFSDTDSDPFNGVGSSLGLFNASATNNPHAMQSYSFASSSTQFVQMELLTNHGGALVGFSEAAFVTSVPEPSSMGLAVFVGTALLGFRKRRRVVA